MPDQETTYHGGGFGWEPPRPAPKPEPTSTIKPAEGGK